MKPNTYSSKLINPLDELELGWSAAVAISNENDWCAEIIVKKAAESALKRAKVRSVQPLRSGLTPSAAVTARGSISAPF